MVVNWLSISRLLFQCQNSVWRDQSSFEFWAEDCDCVKNGKLEFMLISMVYLFWFDTRSNNKEVFKHTNNRMGVYTISQYSLLLLHLSK